MSRRRGRTPVAEHIDLCALQGCNFKVGYKTVEGGVKKMSRYCKHHTCRAIGDGNFCIHAKDFSPGVKYCQFHRQCGLAEQGCEEHSEGPVNELPWFCIRHQCARAECTKPRLATSRYCQGHLEICKSESCEKPTDGHRIWCPDHSCEISGCSSVAEENNRCVAHGSCGVLGCNRLRRSNGRFCKRHTCDIPRCSHIVESGGRCRYHFACSSGRYCSRSRAPGKAFCAGHSCEIEGCTNEQVRRNRCKVHLPCGKEGCGRFQIKDQSGDGTAGYCDKHIPCQKEECPNSVAGKNEDFCKHHKCSIDGCSAEREGRSQFCTSHTCRVTACVQPLSNLESADIRYCQLHECAETGCADRARSFEGFCNLHGCAVQECPAGRSADSHSYCDNHRCRVSGCSAEGSSPGQYCYASRHACVEKGCKERRADDEIAMGLCLPHFRRHAEQQAASDLQREYEEWLRRQARENECLRRQNEQAQRDRERRDREEAAARRRDHDIRGREEEANRTAERLARDRLPRREEERLRREEEERTRAAAAMLARELRREEEERLGRNTAHRRRREDRHEDEFNGGWW